MSQASPPPEPDGQRPRRVRAPGAYLALPLWQRFALSMSVATALLVAMVLYVNAHNTDSQTSTNVAAAGQANREAEILVAQDQAPRSVRLESRRSATRALEAAIRARMATLIAAGGVSGPLRGARCRPATAIGARQGFTCTVFAGGIRYQFLGVADRTARRITFCKRDPPPVASDRVPVSPRCQA